MNKTYPITSLKGEISIHAIYSLMRAVPQLFGGQEDLTEELEKIDLYENTIKVHNGHGEILGEAVLDIPFRDHLMSTKYSKHVSRYLRGRKCIPASPAS